MPSLEEVLNEAVGSAPEPAKFPTGKYQFVVRAMPEHHEETDKSAPSLQWSFGVVAPLDGVDMTVYQKANSGGGRGISIRMFLDEEGRYYLDKALQAMGFPAEGSRKEKLAQAVGHQFIAKLSYDKKGYTKISNYEAVPA